MADLTFTAVVDESRVITLPPEVPLGAVEVVVRTRAGKGNGLAVLKAIRDAPKVDDPAFFERAREELRRMREED